MRLKLQGLCAICFLITLFESTYAGSSKAAADKQASPTFPPDLKLYETKYYRVYTDIDPAQAREACIRMTRMAEEYHVRTAEFAGDIREKLPFYLFKSADEYYAAGGLAKTAGVFNGSRLMAMDDPRVGKQIWHIVQHEGFHQFVHAVIGGEIPIWVNEGMAEYFGEAIFTGDGFVVGVIPQWRLMRIKKTIQNGGFKSIASMMRLSHTTWNSEMNIANYDQAWSMVHFLAHGDGGRYQSAFEGYMRLISHGRDSEDAWDGTFGNDTAGFERQWKAYWTKLPDNPTSELYAKATVATLTSFFARAVAQKQTFDDFDEFCRDANDGSLKTSPDEWLPPSLLEAAMRDVAHREQLGEKFSLPKQTGKRSSNVFSGVTDDTVEGLHVAGDVKLQERHVEQVTVAISGTKHAVDAAPLSGTDNAESRPAESGAPPSVGATPDR